VVQNPGKCVRLTASSMKEEFKRLGSVMTGLLRYTQALMAQMTQAVVCNRHHTIPQQFCRYLLYSLDRVQEPRLAMTHDMVATVLGVRRESVTQVARKLQNDGLIQYSRGHITVLDREGIEDRACECYSVVRNAFGRLFPPFSKDHEHPQSSGFIPLP
jgi:CRP-like cAMP-binding protein